MRARIAAYRVIERPYAPKRINPFLINQRTRYVRNIDTSRAFRASAHVYIQAGDDAWRITDDRARAVWFRLLSELF